MDEVTAKNVKTAIELDKKLDAKVTVFERCAISVNNFAGSTAFIIWHCSVFAAWIAWNSLGGKLDPYPFTFLTMAVSLESILLASLLLISQNRISKQQDRRHMLDLQINMLAEQENTAMLIVIDRIAKKLGVDATELKDYIDETKPEEVMQALEAEENLSEGAK